MIETVLPAMDPLGSDVSRLIEAVAVAEVINQSIVFISKQNVNKVNKLI